MNGKKLLTFTGFITGLKFVFTFLMPSVGKRFNIKLFDEKVTLSFKDMILEMMEMRKKNKIYRPDMINILMQVREGRNLTHRTDEKSNETLDGYATVKESEIGLTRVTRKWTDNELVAQCLIFFLAGFETSSLALSLAAYELVSNPDIQQKLYEEIKTVNDEIGGKRISYDSLQKMKYLDQVVSETLRKWPIGVQIDRICVKDYVYDDGDKLKFHIEKGTNVVFSLYGVHRDPKYYPDPEKFDPERFSNENKHHILPGTYAPFGIGPRNCIGQSIF